MRLTCTCDTPMMRLTCCWVMSRAKRSRNDLSLALGQALQRSLERQIQAGSDPPCPHPHEIPEASAAKAARSSESTDTSACSQTATSSGVSARRGKLTGRSGGGRAGPPARFCTRRTRTARSLTARLTLPAVITQKTAGSPRRSWERHKSKLRSRARRVKAAHRLDEADTGKLIQIVRLRTAPEIPPRDGMDESAVFRDEHALGFTVAFGCTAQQRRHALGQVSRSRRAWSWSRPCRAPAQSAHESRSVKLSMMVKPMPLRANHRRW